MTASGAGRGSGTGDVRARRLAGWLAPALALLLLACSTYRVSPVRVGALYPSKGDRCGLRFENLNFQEGSSKYENLGLVSLTGASSDEFSDGMKGDVERAACHMGGDAVTLNGSGPGFFQFIVWRAR